MSDRTCENLAVDEYDGGAERWWRWKWGSIKKNMPSVSGLITTDLTSKQHGRQPGATVPLNKLNYRCFCVWVSPKSSSRSSLVGPCVSLYVHVCPWLSLCVPLHLVPSYFVFLYFSKFFPSLNDLLSSPEFCQSFNEFSRLILSSRVGRSDRRLPSFARCWSVHLWLEGWYR